MPPLYTPKRDEVVVVPEIPDCYFCGVEGKRVPGPYDFATRMGAWANGCEKHYHSYRAASGLGVGKAQLWITDDQVARTPLQAAKKASQEARRTAIDGGPR